MTRSLRAGRLLLALSAPLLLPAPAGAQTVDEIIDRAIAARGGAEQIRGFRSERLVGSISFNNSPAAPFVVEIEQPGHMRNEIQVQGKTLVQVTDGTSGWSLNPLGASPTAQPLSPGEVANMVRGSDLEGPLFEYQRKGNQVTLVERVAVEGRDAWKLRIQEQSGDSSYRYVDCETALEVRWDGWIQNGSTAVGVRSFFRDWRKVDGVMVAFRIDSDTPGTSFVQQILIDSAVINPRIEPERFGKP